jgi:hypothetical protein
MRGDPLVFFISLFLAITAFWAVLGWVLGRYIGRFGIVFFAVLALGAAGVLINQPQVLREGIGLIPLFVSMGAGALVCLNLGRKHPRSGHGPSGHS